MSKILVESEHEGGRIYRLLKGSHQRRLNLAPDELTTAHAHKGRVTRQWVIEKKKTVRNGKVAAQVKNTRLTPCYG